MAMRSKLELFVHLVWATKRRAERLTEDWERAAYRCMNLEANRLNCKVLAIGGMPDHVHVVLQLASTVSVAQVVKPMKGVSSALLNDMRGEFTEPFAWQDGYAGFSLSKPHLRTVMAYVRNQKRRHATGQVWPFWEVTTEAAGRGQPGTSPEIAVEDKLGE